MATLAENKFVWDGDYDWPQRGDEWSGPWGGPAMQWYGAILPRIHSMVDQRKILEIACGYGRWTQFLNARATTLTVVDLSQECIDACRKRFRDEPIEFHVNDGTSLEMIATDSIQFVFSYDSLVHADLGVIAAYLSQLNRILTDDGAAFIHHSNLGEYSDLLESKSTAADASSNTEKSSQVTELSDENIHWRDPTVSAELVEQSATKCGLRCISQELIGWDSTKVEIDCYSTIVKQNSPRARDNIVFRNREHSCEIKHIKNLSRLYAN